MTHTPNHDEERTMQDFTPGDVIAARPWKVGRELAEAKGIVVVADFGNDSEYVLAWFPTMGDLTQDEVGHAYQPILKAKAVVVGGLWGMPKRTLELHLRKVRASGLQEAGALHANLVSALSKFERSQP